jgi:hypothetical protein
VNFVCVIKETQFITFAVSVILMVSTLDLSIDGMYKRTENGKLVLKEGAVKGFHVILPSQAKRAQNYICF